MLTYDKNFLPVYFNRLKNYILAQQDELIEKHGLKRSQIMFMMLLLDGESQTMGEITEFLGVDKSHTSRVIKELEELKLVERYYQKESLKSYNIGLTKTGEGVALEMKNHSKMINAKMIAVLSEEELKELRRLEKILLEIVTRNQHFL